MKNKKKKMSIPLEMQRKTMKRKNANYKMATKAQKAKKRKKKKYKRNKRKKEGKKQKENVIEEEIKKISMKMVKNKEESKT